MERIKKPIHKKWWFWVMIAAVLIFGAAANSDNKNSSTASGSAQNSVSLESSTPAAESSSTAATELAKKEPEIDKNTKTIIEGTTLTQKESEDVFKDLKSVGFKNVTKVEKALGEGIDTLQAFIFTCDGVRTTVTIEKRKVNYIGAGSIDLFDSTKGGKLNIVTDYIVPSEKEISSMMSAEDYVKQALKAPSTAEFPGQVWEREEWKVSRNKDLLQVSSYVDSENSFGAMLRSNFVVQMDYETEKLIYMSIGDQVVYGEPYKEKSNKD